MKENNVIPKLIRCNAAHTVTSVKQQSGGKRATATMALPLQHKRDYPLVTIQHRTVVTIQHRTVMHDRPTAVTRCT
jgi:hypothetical protein